MMRSRQVQPRDAFDPEKGEIPAGWKVWVWQEELRRRAEICWDASDAEKLRRWADKITKERSHDR